jgi:magnesium chelatase subunit I
VYEGEQEGAAIVAENLIGQAVRSLFPTLFPKIEKLKRSDLKNPYSAIVDWFAAGNSFALADDLTDDEYLSMLQTIKPLQDLVKKHQPGYKFEETAFLMEFVLWALAEYSNLSKEKFRSGFEFKDLFNSYLSNTLRDSE